jgi:hypothetical protein
LWFRKILVKGGKRVSFRVCFKDQDSGSGFRGGIQGNIKGLYLGSALRKKAISKFRVWDGGESSFKYCLPQYFPYSFL